MSVTVVSDWSKVTKELDRLDLLPGGNTLPLENALSRVFDQTLAIVHVITGSLKNSGATSSSADEDSWTGTISFGGESPGFPNDPVTYAGYEMARGGAHDFLKQAVEFGNQFIDAVVDTLAGREV